MIFIFSEIKIQNRSNKKTFLIVFGFILTLGHLIYTAMRKIVLLITNVFFLCLMISAQSPSSDKKKPSFGIKAGMNFSKLKLDGIGSGLLNSNLRSGFVAGAFVNFPCKKKPFSIQPEFLYSSMGGDIRDDYDQKQNLRFNYFSLPVLFKYQLTKKLGVFAGPQVDVIIYGKESNDIGKFDITNSMETIDALATWGAEWWPWKHVVINGRYMHGFRKIYQIGTVSTNNRGFQLTLGLRFHKAKPWVEPPPPPVVVAPEEKDSDGDGTLDLKDNCPTVPGVAKYAGCPVPDTDKDGVYDDKDKCPEMPGYPELDGCPYPDRDKDGVTDNKDRCPDEPGSTKNDGCPIVDRDNDGVLDAVDGCPDVIGTAANKGCPEIKESIIEKTNIIARSIYFEINSAKLQNVSFGPLTELVQILNDNPAYKLAIGGHTDNTGTDDYNQKLSENRVNTVKDYLASKGIDASRLTATGYGESNPVADNNTKEGRSLNRRVELKLSY